MKAINELSARVVIITCILHGGTHSELFLRAFKKRINLLQKENHSTLKAEIYNQGDSRVVNLTERDLKIITKD